MLGGRRFQGWMRHSEQELSSFSSCFVSSGVEADIESFIDKIVHGWMIRMLEETDNDRAFLRLI